MCPTKIHITSLLSARHVQGALLGKAQSKQQTVGVRFLCLSSAGQSLKQCEVALVTFQSEMI